MIVVARGVINNLIGKRFGRLVVISMTDGRVHRHVVWKCQCDCGNVCIAPTNTLTSGKKVSCGCYLREIRRQAHASHHQTGTKLYMKWQGMRRRCSDPSHKNYADYGGRGIKVCNEWMHSFEKFRDWSTENGYNDNFSIDRIDNDGDYCPENCRWVSQKKQCNNRRSNRYITYNGQTHTLTEWSEIIGIKRAALNNRINTLKWDIERALSMPVKTTQRRSNHDGQQEHSDGD